ncbi:thyrotropin-releasing hormone-degrading ectoenzyme-like [Hemiscyllium ocellatum]|uniref:thyrotropin-releasing hormone-degrading ectoenzyme-like n=1 Tax=Hemiscyllium ocellatum TaxID=170820 RepID=UPI0029669278|nr:thyrotropin-releasing hormone-degrading ectoenzyme-like [Hemiscyllium ocellatum]
MALEDKRDKSMSFTQMVIEEDSMRNGRGLSDQWADSVMVRPRTTERHITVHRRLVLGFAISILGLIIVTIIAVLLSVKFEECSNDGSTKVGNATIYSGAKFNQTRESLSNPNPSKIAEKPWTQLRLPTSIKPYHYDLNLTAFMDNFTFTGEICIWMHCVNPTKYIVLHADKLPVEGVEVTVANTSEHLGIRKYFLYPQNQVLVIMLTRELKAQKHYTATIKYSAKIADELLGFFRSSYVTNGERSYLAVTQFSPTHARKTFPCLDEPVYKATFKIAIKHQESYLALSNMPVDAIIHEEDGWITEQFSPTPRMSTYYLAWAICNFTYKETVTKSGITVRLYARPDAIQRGSGDYALNITKRLLEFYEDYFNVSYSLPKLDLLAVPKYPYAAMENWGLSVFVEQRILLDPGVSSIPYLLDVTMVVVHEICHQWFGDLVTPIWWEDVWLKEGFAHYFEYVGTDYLYPDFNMEKQRFLTDDLHEVMLLDGLASSHPISQEVLQATDIDRVFDRIAYKKGAALIRMVANFMGQHVFQVGLQDFLMEHMFSNAGRNDLWNKLTETLQKIGKTINIREVMDRWTLQMGYPVVTIGRNESSGDTLTISQEHFIYDHTVKSVNPAFSNNSYFWEIPLTVAVGNLSHILSETMVWIKNKTEHHRIHFLDNSSWLLGNLNQTGYFRVNYDLRNWKLLIGQLMTNPEVISVGNRAGLIDDAFNLARAGYLPQNIPLEIIQYLSKEKEFLPWHAASNVLLHLDKLVDRNKEYNIFSQYVLQQVAPAYNLLGWPEDAVNSTVVQASYQTEELRRKVIILACKFGIALCHEKAVSLLSEWMASDHNRIPPNVRDIAYCTGISLMDDNVWDFIWTKYQSSTAVSEKKILLEALACSKNTVLLNRLLNLSLNSQMVPDQTTIDVIIHVAKYPNGRDLAWKFFQDKWNVFKSRYGEALFMNSKLIKGVTDFLSTEAELKELKEFIKNVRAGADASFTQAIEIVEANVRWHGLFEDELFQWLRKSLSS